MTLPAIPCGEHCHPCMQVRSRVIFCRPGRTNCRADYNTTVNSWLEQRTYVTAAPRVVKTEYPQLAASLTKAFKVPCAVCQLQSLINLSLLPFLLQELQAVEAPSDAGLLTAASLEQEFTCEGLTLAFDSHGGVAKLAAQGISWAGAQNTIGTLLCVCDGLRACSE